MINQAPEELASKKGYYMGYGGEGAHKAGETTLYSHGPHLSSL